MDFYGISGTVNKYLDERYQRVSTSDIQSMKVSSKWELVKQGVLQGSILGLLLFLVYINDFSLFINKIATPILFADADDLKHFKSSLRTYLIEHAFYSIDEYYQLTSQ
jgi:hypothetical protein